MVLRLWRVRHGCLRHPCGAEGAAFGAEGATIGACGTEPHERKRCAARAGRTRRSGRTYPCRDHAVQQGGLERGQSQTRLGHPSLCCPPTPLFPTPTPTFRPLTPHRKPAATPLCVTDYVQQELELTTTAPCQCQGAAMAEASTRMTEQWQNHDRTMAELCGNRGRTLWCPAPSARAEAGQNMGQSHCRAWQQLAAARGRLHPWSQGSARAEAGQSVGQSHCRAWQQLAAARGHYGNCIPGSARRGTVLRSAARRSGAVGAAALRVAALRGAVLPCAGVRW
eukprot:gene9638-biopygen13787